MRKLTIDFETRSPAPLKECGAAAYAEHPQTEVICLALKFKGEAPVIWYSPEFREDVKAAADLSRVWDFTMVDSVTVRGMLDRADIIEAHNAQFEYFIWKYVMPRYGFIMFDVRKLRCSAAKAAAFSLPRSLSDACAAAGVPQQKDQEGYKLMLRLCKPRRPRNEDMARDPDWATRTYWYGTPGEFLRLGEYCIQDVRAEESLSEAIPNLPEAEQRLWALDLVINDRGVKVDAPSASAIMDGVTGHSAALEKEFRKATGLSSPRQRDATLGLLRQMGAEMEGLTASDVEGALSTETDPAIRNILSCRQSLSKSSTAKYKALLASMNSDCRVRGCLMYHGAGTGRWTGKLVQPHNFPRGAFSDVEGCIDLFTSGDLEGVDLLYGDPMVAASTCLRGMIVPDAGNDFVCADYSSIEGRVLAWLAGEETALDVYRSGLDPYKVAASGIYKVAYEDVQKPQRQIGKVAELALGYQGSVGAFNAMAANYGVSLTEAEVKSIVESWRESRPRTVALWRELESAAFQAIDNPKAVFGYRGVKFAVRGKFLAMRLPSGRCLWWAAPRFEDKEMVWGSTKKVIAVEGVNSLTRKWQTQYLYGGLLAENLTQATARDILVNGLWNVERAGYAVVMHVHDEILSEVPEGFGSVEEFESLMCALPDWGESIPMKAEGWRGKRYRK